MAAGIYIGTQGWNYEGWKGAFYPRGTTNKEMLSLYSKVFDTVEIDSTFYATPSEHSVRLWIDRTPPGFIFSVKLLSEITHKNRLRESTKLLTEFLNRISIFEEKLGCILIQMPPDFSPSERQSLNSFLEILPGDFRFAVEFRDPAWMTAQTFADLDRRNVAITLVDSKWINRSLSFRALNHLPSDFAYIRWLGPRELTDFSRIQINRDEELKTWGEYFSVLRGKVPTLYGYFNNHFQGHSPASCNQFKRILGMPVVNPETLQVQPSLFSNF